MCSFQSNQTVYEEDAWQSQSSEILHLTVKVFCSNEPKRKYEALKPNQQRCVLLAGQSRKWETVNMSVYGCRNFRKPRKKKRADVLPEVPQDKELLLFFWVRKILFRDSLEFFWSLLSENSSVVQNGHWLLHLVAFYYSSLASSSMWFLLLSHR